MSHRYGCFLYAVVILISVSGTAFANGLGLDGKPVATMPRQTGGDVLSYLQPEFTISGADLISNGVLIEADQSVGPFPLGEFTITSNYAAGFTLQSLAYGGPYPQPWMVTTIPDGVQLDALMGAPSIGQSVPGIVQDEFAYSITYDPASGLTGADLLAFQQSTFTFQATPEPGIATLYGSLMVSLSLLLTRARRRHAFRR